MADRGGAAGPVMVKMMMKMMNTDKELEEQFVKCFMQTIKSSF